MWGWHETVSQYGLMHEMGAGIYDTPVGKEGLAFFSVT